MYVIVVMSHDLPHPFLLLPSVATPVVDPDPMDEVDIPQVYMIEDAPDSELEAGKKLACKVHTTTVYCH